MDTSSLTGPQLLPTPPTEIRGVYLQRLERLRKLRDRHEAELNHQGVRLLNRSIFEAYCVCRELGAEREARAILGAYPAEPAA
jgi:hypothetical protein